MGDSQSNTPQANILVVDDTPANLQLLVRILVEQGYSVQLASDGRTALSLAQTEPPDLILLDIMMPEMDGYAVCEQLKADERTRDVPVIFLSALNEVFDKVKAFSIGGIDYIIKPFHIEEVLAHVKTHLAVRATQKQLERQNSQLEQEIVERRRLEKELRQHHNQLELKIAERTAELITANQQLQQEIFERERAEEKLQDGLQKLKIAYEQAEIYAQELKKEVIEHKQAEKAVREERDKAQKYLDVAGVMFVVIDTARKVVLINKKGGEVLGYAEKDIIGKNWFDNFLPEGRRNEFKAVFEKLLAGDIEPVEYYENPILTKDGEERMIAWHNTVLTDETGRIIGTLSSGEDITERKQTEAEREQLINLEHEQWLLAETLRQAVAVLNSTLNYEEVLDLILKQMKLVLPFHDAADIMLIEQNSVRALRWHGYEQFEAETYIASLEFNIAEIPTLQTMWTTDRPLVIPEVENYQEWVYTPETAWIKSYMGVPIHIREQVIGFINVNSATPGLFKESDAERLQALADQAGVALENARLFGSVNQQREQLRALTARLAEAEEVERRQLARELHDQAGQNLTALSLNLRMAHNQIAKAGKLSKEKIEQVGTRLDDSLALVKETTKRIRNVMDYLRPPALEEYGLVAALRWYGQEFTSRTNIAVTVQGEEPDPRLSAFTETALFRIAQEALTNVSRHAQATQVEVKLTVDQAMVCLVIADNGIGFEAKRPAKRDERQHWGLLNMAERAQAVGGQCRVESAPGEGTRVIVEVER